MTDRLLLLTTSPRLPAGLLSWPAWEAVRSAPVYAASDSAQAQALGAAGVEVTVLDYPDDRARAHAFRDRSRVDGAAVWLAAPDPAAQAGFVRALGDLVAREGGAEIEVVYGSWDPPGARLLDVVAVMDRLRSPGGCPWDAEQTHRSLMPYLLEEAYEAYAALEERDADALREELGDVLLQIAFHARIAEEAAPEEAWSIDDVAGELVDKLVRRHPHVFADVTVSGAAETEVNWDVIKAAEKPRESVTDGVPLSQPALSLAAKLQKRAAKAGVPRDLLELVPPERSTLGARLFALVAEARAAGEDPEAALRAVARAFRDRVAAVERGARDDGRDPAALDAEEWRARWTAESD